MHCICYVGRNNSQWGGSIRPKITAGSRGPEGKSKYPVRRTFLFFTVCHSAPRWSYAHDRACSLPRVYGHSRSKYPDDESDVVRVPSWKELF